jgi:hypothetical protein
MDNATLYMDDDIVVDVLLGERSEQFLLLYLAAEK